MIRASDYGRALFELARQEHREGEIGEEMAGVRAILEQQPAYARLLDSPALPREQRLSLVEEAFSSLNLYHLNFLKILCEKHAVKQYAACARVYGQLRSFFVLNPYFSAMDIKRCIFLIIFGINKPPFKHFHTEYTAPSSD